jgi:hypothetical protein
MINVGQDNVPPGRTWYWAGINQPGRDLVAVHAADISPFEPMVQAALALEHGVDERTSVGVLARTMLLQDQRVTFVEGSVRRSIGSALIEVGAAKESGGGTAARAQVLAKFGSVNVSAEAVATNDFHLNAGQPVSARDVRLAVDAPIRLGRTPIPVHGDVHYSDRPDGSGELEAAARFSALIDRFNLAAGVRYSQHYLAKGPGPPPEVLADLIGTGRIGPVRVRGATEFEMTPHSRLRTAEITGYWSASERADWEGTLAYDGPQHRARARISHIRRFDAFALAITGEAATDGSFALGFNLNFSLDWAHGLDFSRERIASAGSVRARVFRDLNDNGSADPGEPFEKGALVKAGHIIAKTPTGEDGRVMVAGLPTFAPITVGIDRSSLGDPMLAPKKALQVVVPRPGVPAEVDIALVGAGDIEGAVVKNGGLGFEGLDLELVDSSGAVAATARSDFDGYFLFDRVPYGSYTVRISKVSAAAAKVSQQLDLKVTVTDEDPIVRTGTIHVEPAPQIASAE